MLTKLAPGTYIDSDAVEGSFGMVYPYLDWRGNWLQMGLALMETPSHQGKRTDHSSVTSWQIEDFAPYLDIGQVREAAREGGAGRSARRRRTDWVPGARRPTLTVAPSYFEGALVWIENLDEYEELMALIGFYSPYAGGYEGPGLYNSDAVPPNFEYREMAAYEEDERQRAMDEALDYLFQGDEWKTTRDHLLREAAEE